MVDSAEDLYENAPCGYLSTDLAAVRVPALVLQCSSDAIAPMAVGEYVDRSLPDSRLAVLRATGHCPNLSAPEETVAAMKGFL